MLKLFNNYCMTMKKGIYKHYKGNLYKVITVARHSETEEEMVVYQALYGNFEYWVRPKVMFEENIHHKGENIKRFEFIDELK